MKSITRITGFVLSISFLCLSCTEKVLGPSVASTTIRMGRTTSPLQTSASGIEARPIARVSDHRFIIVPKTVTGLMEQHIAFVGEAPVNTSWPVGGVRNSCELSPNLVNFDFSEINTFIEESEDIYRDDATLGTYDTIKLFFSYLEFLFDFNGQEYELRLYFNDYDGHKAESILIDGSEEDSSIAIEKLWQFYQTNIPPECETGIIDFTLDAKEPFTMDDKEASAIVTVELDFSTTISFSPFPTIDEEGSLDLDADPLFSMEDIDNLTINDILPGMMYPYITFAATVQYIN